MTAGPLEPIRLYLVVHFLTCDLTLVELSNATTAQHIIVDVCEAALVLSLELRVVLFLHHELTLRFLLAQACTQEQAFPNG